MMSPGLVDSSTALLEQLILRYFSATLPFGSMMKPVLKKISG